MFLCFFFQAEDGIRDAQESRGLGDVYKRQADLCETGAGSKRAQSLRERALAVEPAVSVPPTAGGHPTHDELGRGYDGPAPRDRGGPGDLRVTPVSYTHLTLPTISPVSISVVAV